MNVTKIFKRGYVMFKEGQKPIDGIYLVMEGEFEETMKYRVDGNKKSSSILSLKICGKH